MACHCSTAIWKCDDRPTRTIRISPYTGYVVPTIRLYENVLFVLWGLYGSRPIRAIWCSLLGYKKMWCSSYEDYTAFALYGLHGGHYLDYIEWIFCIPISFLFALMGLCYIIEMPYDIVQMLYDITKMLYDVTKMLYDATICDKIWRSVTILLEFVY